MANEYTVSDSIESADGGSGRDCDDYGPFATEVAAEDFAKRLASEGYVSHDEEIRLVQVIQNGSNYGGEPRHALYDWRSSDDDGNTRHTLGPSDDEKAALLIHEEAEDSAAE